MLEKPELQKRLERRRMAQAFEAAQEGYGGGGSRGRTSSVHGYPPAWRCMCSTTTCYPSLKARGQIQDGTHLSDLGANLPLVRPKYCVGLFRPLSH